MPTLAQIVEAVWSTEIQPGLTARDILAAWLRYLEVGEPTGTGPDDEDDVERWHAAGRKAAARFAPVVTLIDDHVRTATTRSPEPPKRLVAAPIQDRELEDIEMMLMLMA